jgi:hypothetical protein
MEVGHEINGATTDALQLVRQPQLCEQWHRPREGHQKVDVTRWARGTNSATAKELCLNDDMVA